MTIEIIWDNPEKTRLRYDISGEWTWAELKQAQERVFQMLDDSPAAQVGTIAHFIEGRVRVPGDSLQRLRENIDFQGHPKAGLTVIVGANLLMRSTFGMLRRAYTMTGRELDFAYAQNLAEARRLITEYQQRNS